MKHRCSCVLLICATPLLYAADRPKSAPDSPLVATFSVCGFDPATGDLGVAVQSKFFGVGSVVPWARANVGAIATQSYANVTYGRDGLKSQEST